MLTNRLSRWTLLFFAFALVNELAAQGLAVGGLTWPCQSVTAAGTLVAVHLLTIGWLLLLMLGALFQFVPVITSQPLASQSLSLATLAAVESGLLGMTAGFLGVTGQAPALAPALPAGAITVMMGVLVACVNIGVPLLRARPLALPGRMVFTALGFLLLTVALGFSFAIVLTVPTFASRLAPLLAGVGDHALGGLGGWFTLTAMGVGYKLLAMFMLAPEERGIAGECVHYLGAVGFALAIAAGLTQIWIPAGLLRIIEMSGYSAAALAIAIFLWDVARLYRTRKRAVIEAHNWAAVGAFAFLGLAAALTLAYLGKDRLAFGAPVIVFLAIFGWLGGLGLTQLYKIVPFLTWLRRYGSHLGRGTVPRVQDLVKESRGYVWFIAYFLGILLAAVSAVVGAGLAFRSSMALAMLATLGLTIEYWRAWRASYVQLAMGMPSATPFLSHRRS
jgi:hypothetical protein